MGLAIEWLGRVAYAEGLDIQKAAVEDRRAGRTGDRLLLLEHPPVVTFGRSGRSEHLRVPPAELTERGIELHHVARGGDVTYHGPGQLVGYPIVDLGARADRDVHRLLRRLEGALIEALAALRVRAGRVPGWTGVFVPETVPPRKIASIGVGLRGWITCHGFALNVTMDLAEFGVIVPCGLAGVAMTSVARELRVEPSRALFDRARRAVAAAFAEAFA
jgi:lipoate-protein ligase B